MTRRLAALCVSLLALALAGGARAQPAGPSLQPPVTIDGPAAGIGPLSGLDVARDGSGGLVYLKSVAGAEHVFVSRLVSGGFQGPVQVDASLPGGSSQPVLAAGDDGLLLVAFINGGQLYVVTRTSSSAPFGAPRVLGSGASNPAIAMSIHEKGYLAFTVVGSGGHDVRAAYYYNGRWSVESSPLDANPADDAGTGTGAPSVAAAGDGEGIIAWGEAGHVYSRRMWASSPSVVFEQADAASMGGFNEVGADLPKVATGDDSSYAWIAYHELLTNGSAQQSRVLVNELRGSRYTGNQPADGLTTPGSEGAANPSIALSEYDDGFVAAARDSSLQVVATRFGSGGVNQGVARVDSLQNASVPFTTVATTGFFSAVVAWQHDPGPTGSTDVRVRFYDGTTFGPELVASSPAQGPTNAAQGLLASGDSAGDMPIAWVQGTGAQTVIEAARLFSAPGSFGPSGPATYSTSSTPVLSWSAAREQWGSVRYTVVLDGAQVGQTGATSLRVPQALADGPHTWQVTAANQAGLTSTARAAGFLVDTFAPLVQFRLTGPERAGSFLRLRARYSDTPPLLPSRVASGIASVTVNWGDGTTSTIHSGALHAYPRAGSYRLIVIVTDRAGNVTKLARRLRIGKQSK